MGLSVAASLLAVALVVGLLAWVRRDLRARGAPMRAWWIVVACYAFAAVVWLVAITVPLPVTVAWLATVPAAVATVIPERLAAWLGGIGRAGRDRRPSAGARSTTRHPGAHRVMAHPVGGRPAVGVVNRRSTTHRPSTPTSPEREPQPSGQSAPAGAATGTLVARADLPAPGPYRPVPEPDRPVAGADRPAPARQRHVPVFGRHHRAPGDLRLAVELLEDATRIPDLDEAARGRIEVRLGRLDRFHGPATDELLALVRADVHARLVSDVPSIDPDPVRTRRMAALLDELDPR